MVVYLEAEDPERMASVLAASEEPFDLWFKERLIECHGRNPAPRRAAAELIFAYQDVADDGHRPRIPDNFFERGPIWSLRTRIRRGNACGASFGEQIPGPGAIGQLHGAHRPG
jgi:hypothetical protein